MKELYKALFDFTHECPQIKRTTAAYGYKYAPYEYIRDEIDPFLLKHELGIMHTGICIDGQDYWRTILFHKESGESEKSDIRMKTKLTLPYDDKQKKYVGTQLVDNCDPQLAGAAQTYYSRYGMVGLLALKIVGEDTDGLSTNDKIALELAHSKKNDSTANAAKFQATINKMEAQFKICNGVIPPKIKEFLVKNGFSDEQKSQINNLMFKYNITLEDKAASAPPQAATDTPPLTKDEIDVIVEAEFNQALNLLRSADPDNSLSDDQISQVRGYMQRTVLNKYQNTILRDAGKKIGVAL